MSSFYQRGAEKRRNWQEMRLREQEVGTCSTRPMSPKNQLDQEKRVRREIANSNERRRMQSINAGFQSLKALLPQQDGEKLSKAAILQQTADYVYQLEHDKSQLLKENSEMKHMLGQLGKNPEDFLSHSSPPPKRKKRDTESSDEGISLLCGDVEDHVEEAKQEMAELRDQLESEQKRRMLLEDKSSHLDNKMYEDEDLSKYSKDKDVMMSKWMKEEEHEVEAAQRVPRPGLSPSPPLQHAQVTTSHCNPTPFHTQVNNVNNCLSVSRRNLDTIVEAIRHLEGDAMSVDHHHERSVPTSCNNSHIPHSEESGTESSYEQEDCRSESSALSEHDSPTSTPMECETSPAGTTFTASDTVHIAHQSYNRLHHQAQLLSSHHLLPTSHPQFTSSSSEVHQPPLQLLTAATPEHSTASRPHQLLSPPPNDEQRS